MSRGIVTIRKLSFLLAQSPFLLVRGRNTRNKRKEEKRGRKNWEVDLKKKGEERRGGEKGNGRGKKGYSLQRKKAPCEGA